jgi:hypothetical protein
MTFPLTGTTLLASAILFGAAFGWLLHRGRVTSYDTIVNQFRMRDFTVLKVMVTAILVGGVGVLFLIDGGAAKYHIKDANLLAVGLGAALFGVGMAIYGYCPGTAVAAIGAGSLHALVGAFGMLLGGMLYALSFDWVSKAIIPVWALGKARLPQMTGVPDIFWFGLLAAVLAGLFLFTERRAPGH